MYLSIWKEALRFSFSFTIYCKRQHSPISKLKKTSLCIYLIITNKFHPNILLYFLEYKTHPPNLGGKWGCILQSECSSRGLLWVGAVECFFFSLFSCSETQVHLMVQKIRYGFALSYMKSPLHDNSYSFQYCFLQGFSLLFINILISSSAVKLEVVLHSSE